MMEILLISWISIGVLVFLWINYWSIKSIKRHWFSFILVSASGVFAIAFVPAIMLARYMGED